MRRKLDKANLDMQFGYDIGNFEGAEKEQKRILKIIKSMKIVSFNTPAGKFFYVDDLKQKIKEGKEKDKLSLTSSKAERGKK